MYIQTPMPLPNIITTPKKSSVFKTKNLISTIYKQRKKGRRDILMWRMKIILLNIFLEMPCSFYVIRVHECGKISRFSHSLNSYRCYFFSRRIIRQLFMLKWNFFFQLFFHPLWLFIPLVHYGNIFFSYPYKVAC